MTTIDYRWFLLLFAGAFSILYGRIRRAKRRKKLKRNKLLFYIGCFNLLKVRDISSGLWAGLYGLR